MYKLLFRPDQDNQDEYHAAQEVWGDAITTSRSLCREGDLVIGRYSVLPWYRELEKDLNHQGAKLINSSEQYEWIAEMSWYDELAQLTPATYFNAGYVSVPNAPHGWVVKGRTNSRKFKWATHMRAPDRDTLRKVLTRCYDDPLLGDQGLVIREYVPLRTYEVGLHGLPVTNEWRFFFWKGHFIDASYYWSQGERADEFTTIPEDAMTLAMEAAQRIKAYSNFYVVDVGEMVESPGSEKSAGWTVIEVNSGQMAGLSSADLYGFYQKLKKVVDSIG
jgi:hypothetical protein